MPCGSKNLKLAKKHGSKVVLFKDLPNSHKLAIIWYMAADGEAWNFPNDNWEHHLYWSDPDSSKLQQKYYAYLRNYILRNMDSYYIPLYGKTRWGVVEIPTDVMKQEMVARSKSRKGYEDWTKEHPTFDAYHEWYMKFGGWFDHTKHISRSRSYRWPCIMSGYNHEVLEDGWHRFHSYIERGDKTIPCIYYIETKWPLTHGFKDAKVA